MDDFFEAIVADDVQRATALMKRAKVDAPTIAVAVFVEAGGNIGENASGGSVAAPIASQLISGWLNR